MSVFYVYVFRTKYNTHRFEKGYVFKMFFEETLQFLMKKKDLRVKLLRGVAIPHR